MSKHVAEITVEKGLEYRLVVAEAEGHEQLSPMATGGIEGSFLLITLPIVYVFILISLI